MDLLSPVNTGISSEVLQCDPRLCFRFHQLTSLLELQTYCTPYPPELLLPEKVFLSYLRLILAVSCQTCAIFYFKNAHVYCNRPG